MSAIKIFQKEQKAGAVVEENGWVVIEMGASYFNTETVAAGDKWRQEGGVVVYEVAGAHLERGDIYLRQLGPLRSAWETIKDCTS